VGIARAVSGKLNYIKPMNTLEPLQSVDGNFLRWRGRRLVCFSGCDYFRLAQHPAVQRAAVAGLKQFGLNVAASRLTTGHHVIYDRLEAALTRYFAAPAVLVVPSGYTASAVAAQALAGEFSHALLDERAHAALRDAALQLGCPVWTFKHRDATDLKRLAQRAGRRARLLVLTDGMFSHNGAVAPLRAYLKVLPRSAQLLVDDAHGAGVLGQHGRGTLEHERVSRSRIIQCITLSKAFGVYGGAVLGPRVLRKAILERSRGFMGCTPLPPPLANAVLTAVERLGKSPAWRKRLHANAAWVRVALRQAGWPVTDEPGPIIAIYPQSEAEARSMRQRLLRAGIYPPFVRYGGNGAGWFRFVISSAHSPAQLAALVEALGLFEEIRR
jgi:8-amino-7-oxononanoate synthase